MEAYSIRITGKVQGVGFRYYTLRSALGLNLDGWVKNMPDGSVLVHVRGTAETLDTFRNHLRKGPSFSRVEGLQEDPLDLEQANFNGFQVNY